MVHPLTTALAGAVVAQAGDRGSLSDELHFAARDRAERLHLDRGRANLLRALALPPSARVLHLGAGGGALTRFLGETVAEGGTVDAVEPDPELAAICAARTAELPGVQVHSAVPEARYDLVVAVGLLESLTAPGDRLDFLRTALSALNPGGTLILATENQFGVRNLAGAPDTWTHRRWDAVEGHPFGGPAKPPARRPLENLLAEAGFAESRLLGCFPDHLITRVVLSRELLDEQPRLAIALPRLPSTDHGHDSPRPVDEAKLWEQLVEAGQAADAVNSFLVLATAPGGEPLPLWPADRLAVYFNTDRAAPFCTAAEVTRREVRRTPLAPGDQSGEVSVQAWTDPLYDGPTIVAALAEKPWLAEELLVAWRALVGRRAGELGPALWDLLPHNVVVAEDGLLYPIDLEWRFAEATPETVLRRGLLMVAEQLAGLAWPGAGPSSTVRDVANWLGALLDIKPGFVDEAVRLEARFQALSRCGDAQATLDAEEGRIRAAWHHRLSEAVAVRDLPGVEKA